MLFIDFARKHPIILRCPSERSAVRPIPGYPDWDSRGLKRLGKELDLLDLVMLSLERDSLACP